ncbi:MAG: putative toxin-antitoxin system toxin component, PIN family [Erythrobacter sp.]
MRIIIDTNVLVSALLSESAPPGQLLAHWRQARFRLLSCADQLEELRRVTRYPKIRARLSPALAGRLVNELSGLAEMIENLPSVDVSRDPWDNYLLAMAQVGNADYLVTGDKADLLSLQRHGRTHIVTVRNLLGLLGQAIG